MTFCLSLIIFSYFILPINIFYILSINKNTQYFYGLTFLNNIILEILDWIEKDKYLIFIWLIFILTMSFSVRNKFGYDVSTIHYHIFSFAMLYITFIYRQLVQRNIKFLILKILLISALVLKRLWSTIYHLWPWSYFLLTFSDLTEWFLFFSTDFQFLR